MSLEESKPFLRDLSYDERYRLAEAEARKAEAEARKAEAEARKACLAELSGIDADKKAEIILALAQSRQVYR